MNISDNFPSIVEYLPHILSLNQIVELRLVGCSRQLSLNAPSLSRLILIDSLDVLNSNIAINNIRSIQIVLYHPSPGLVSDSWIALRAISTLRQLHSLRVNLYGMRIPPDDTSCQMIAETAPVVSDFAFCFRRPDEQPDYDIDAAYKKHYSFIQQLGSRILLLPLKKEPYLVIEKTGHGIVIWF